MVGTASKQADTGTIVSPLKYGVSGGKLKGRYFICTLPRTGSWLLAQGLSETGIAGKPEEYFRPDYEIRYCEMWGIKGQVGVHEYLAGVLQAGTTRNGVFGAKIHWSQFRHLVCSLHGNVEHDMLDAAATVAQSFPDLRYLWLRRRDKARQAISYLKAIQTNRWWVVAGRETSQNVLPSFDFDAIAQFEEMLTEQDACWDQYFKACKARPLVIYYEDLARSFRSTILGVLRYLQIPAAENVPLEMPALVRQADEISEQWFKQYQNKKKPS